MGCDGYQAANHATANAERRWSALESNQGWDREMIQLAFEFVDGRFILPFGDGIQSSGGREAHINRDGAALCGAQIAGRSAIYDSLCSWNLCESCQELSETYDWLSNTMRCSTNAPIDIT